MRSQASFAKFLALKQRHLAAVRRQSVRFHIEHPDPVNMSYFESTRDPLADDIAWTDKLLSVYEKHLADASRRRGNCLLCTHSHK